MAKNTISDTRWIISIAVLLGVYTRLRENKDPCRAVQGLYLGRVNKKGLGEAGFIVTRG